MSHDVTLVSWLKFSDLQTPSSWLLTILFRDAGNQRYFFIAGVHASTLLRPLIQLLPLSPPPAHSTSKRRQYAAGQTQAYYGAADGIAGFEAGYGGAAPQQQVQFQGQLFTPSW
jgi:protein transport protein SEC24